MQDQNQAAPQLPQIWNDQTNLAEAEKLKLEGNVFFTQKQYKQALKKYHKAILHLAGIIDKDSAVAMYAKTAPKEISLKANSLKFSIWLNMSQIYIYQQKYDKGLQIIKKSGQILQTKLPEQKQQQFLPKLFYRQGICQMKLNYLNEARQAFNRVKQLDQSFSKEIQQLQKEVNQRQKKANEKSKKLYQGFFK